MAWTKTGNIQGPPGSGGSAGIPIRPTQTGDYTFVLADANTYTPSDYASLVGATFTVPANSSVAYPNGTILGAVAVSTTGKSVSLSASVGVDFLGLTYGLAIRPGDILTALKVATDTWIIQVSNLALPINGAFPAITGATVVTKTYSRQTASSGGVLTLDSSLANLFYSPSTGMTENISTINITNLSTSVRGFVFGMQFVQPVSGGPYTVAFPSSFKFVAGSDTAIQTAAGSFTNLFATTFNGGTRWECVMRAGG